MPQTSLAETIRIAAEMSAICRPFRIDYPVQIVGSEAHAGSFPVFQLWMNDRKIGQKLGGVWFWLPYPGHPLKFSHEQEMIAAVRKAEALSCPHMQMSGDVADMIKRAAPHMNDATLALFTSISRLHQYNVLTAALEQEALQRITKAGSASKPQGRL